MAVLLKIVHDNKAEKLLRFVNYLIDLAFCYFLIIILFGIGSFAYSVITGNSLSEVANSLSSMNSLLDRLVTLLSYVMLMFLFEFLTKGRSLGKFITGTMVVKSDGKLLTMKDYFQRNICRAIPFEIFSFLGNNGWHDSIYDTRVVKKKAYEEAQAQKIDLDNLGKRNEI